MPESAFSLALCADYHDVEHGFKPHRKVVNVRGAGKLGVDKEGMTPGNADKQQCSGKLHRCRKGVCWRVYGSAGCKWGRARVSDNNT